MIWIFWSPRGTKRIQQKTLPSEQVGSQIFRVNLWLNHIEAIIFCKSQARFSWTSPTAKGNHGKRNSWNEISHGHKTLVNPMLTLDLDKKLFSPEFLPSATKKHLRSARMVRDFGRKHFVITAQPLWLKSWELCILYYIVLFPCNCHLCLCKAQPACDENNQKKRYHSIRTDKSHGHMSYTCHRFNGKE